MGERLGHLYATGLWSCDDGCDNPPPHGHPSLKGPRFIGNRPLEIEEV